MTAGLLKAKSKRRKSKRAKRLGSPNPAKAVRFASHDKMVRTSKSKA